MFEKDCESWWSESDYLPFKAVIDYWCSDDPSCREAKKNALLSALERGEVEYQRSDGKTFEDPIYELNQRGLILVQRESFLSWSKSITGEVEDPNLRDSLVLDPRSETTYLNIIGAMLRMLQDEHPGSIPFSNYQNQSEIISKLVELYGEKPGISQRNLEKKFAAAKRELDGS